MIKILNISHRNSISNNQFYRKIDALITKGIPTYATLPLMDDAMELWNYVLPYNPTILTSTGHKHPEIIDREKRVAVNHHFGPKPKIITVQHSHLKAEYATPTTILIDDREKSIDPWIEKGGIGILHTSAADTIKRLKDLGV